MVAARVKLPALGIVVACLSLDARGRACADGIRGGMTLATRVDDGAVSPTNEFGWVGTWTPFAQWYGRGSSARWDFEARRRFEAMPGAVSPRPAMDVAKAAVSSQPEAPTIWKVIGRYQRTRDLVSLDPQTVATPGVIEVGEAVTFLGLSRVEAGWAMRSTARQDPRDVDGWSQNATATILPLRNPTTAWLVQGGYRNWTLDNQEALRISRVTAGYRRQHTLLLSTEVQVGVAEIDDPLNPATDSELAWTAAATGFARVLGVPLDSKVHLSKDMTVTGALDLGRGVSGISLSLHAARSLEAEGGVFASPVLRDFVAFTVADTFAGDWMASVEASVALNRPYSGSGPRVETTRASVALGHRIQTWLVTQASYAYLGQVETNSPQVDRSHRGRVEIGLTASFR